MDALFLGLAVSCKISIYYVYARIDYLLLLPNPLELSFRNWSNTASRNKTLANIDSIIPFTLNYLFHLPYYLQ